MPAYLADKLFLLKRSSDKRPFRIAALNLIELRVLLLRKISYLSGMMLRQLLRQ